VLTLPPSQTAVALLEFALHVYVDTPLLELNVASSPHLWAILKGASRMAAEVWAEVSHAGNMSQLQEQIVTTMLDLVTVYFKDLFPDIDMVSAEIEAGRLYIQEHVVMIAKPTPTTAAASKRKNSSFLTLAKFANVTMGGKSSSGGREAGSYPAVLEKAERAALVIAEEGAPVVPCTPAGRQSRGTKEGSFLDDSDAFSEQAQVDLMSKNKTAYLEVVMNALSKSKRTQAALDKKGTPPSFAPPPPLPHPPLFCADVVFCELVEAVEKLTDPDNVEYLEAATGEDFANMSAAVDETTLADVCTKILAFLGEKYFLVAILVLTVVGCATTVTSIVQVCKQSEHSASTARAKRAQRERSEHSASEASTA
jgi:hypothetical protein